MSVETPTPPADPSKPKFDWDTFLFKVQTSLTSRKFGALLASLGATWTAYGKDPAHFSLPLAIGGTLLALSVYSYSVAHEDAAKK